MSRVDIEFAHVYISPDEMPDPHDMRRSAGYASALADWYRNRGSEVSLSVLIDDYTSPGGDIDAAVEEILGLDLKPDAIYREGDFGDVAEEMIGELRSKFVKQRVTGRTFLADGRDLAGGGAAQRGVTMFDVLRQHNDIAPSRFRFALNFDMDFLDKDGARRLSCPVLAAAWHAYRLGLITAHIEPAWGVGSYPAESVVSVLPNDYLQVEASTRALLSSMGPDGRGAASRCRSVFY